MDYSILTFEKTVDLQRIDAIHDSRVFAKRRGPYVFLSELRIEKGSRSILRIPRDQMVVRKRSTNVMYIEQLREREHRESRERGRERIGGGRGRERKGERGGGKKGGEGERGEGGEREMRTESNIEFHRGKTISYCTHDTVAAARVTCDIARYRTRANLNLT